MDQLAFIASGCLQGPGSTIVVAKSFLAYPSTLSVYVYPFPVDKDAKNTLCLSRVLGGPSSTIRSTAGNEEIIVSVSAADKRVFLWSADSGDPYSNVPDDLFGDTFPFVVAVNSSAPAGGKIAIGCDRGKIVVWDYKIGKSYVVMLKEASENLITCAAWCPLAPHLLAVGTENGWFAVLDTSSLRFTCKMQCFQDLWAEKEGFFDRLLSDKAPRVSSVALDPKSTSYAVVGSSKGFLVLVDMERGNVVQTFESQPHAIAGITFMENQPGCFITCDGSTSAIQFWNVSNRSSLKSIAAKPDLAVVAVAVVPKESLVGSDWIAVAFSDGSVALVDIATAKIGPLNTTPGHSETIFDCRFSHHDPNIMSSSSYDGSIRIWNVKSMQQTSVFDAQRPVYCVDWSPSGDMLVAGLLCGEVVMFSVPSGKRLWTQKVCADVCWRVSWCKREAGIVAASSRDGFVVVLAARTGDLLRTFRHSSPVFGVEFDPTSGKILAAAGYDKKIRLFHLEKNRCVAALVGHESEVSQVQFHPLLSDTLASTSSDNTVRVWKLPDLVNVNSQVNQNTQDGNSDEPLLFFESVVTLRGHTNKTRGLVWSPLCPHLLISGSWDASIRLWDIRNGACVSVVYGHAADIYSLSIHPKRPTIVVSASRDTTIRFWYVNYLSQLHLDAAFGVLRESLVASSDYATELAVNNTNSKRLSEILCAGANVDELLQKLDAEAQPHRRLKLISEFFEFPYGASDIVSCVSYRVTRDLNTIDSEATIAPTEHLANVAITGANRRLEELRGKLSAAVGSSRRNRDLIAAASQYLRLGQVKQHCELLVQAGEWNLALAAAPHVGLEYWRSLCRTCAENVAQTGDFQRAVDLFIMCGDAHRAADLLAANGNVTQAVVVVQSCTQARQNDANALTPTLVSDGDSRTASSKIANFAQAHAKSLWEGGNAMLAAAALIAAGEHTRAIEVIQGASCVPMGLLLLHTLPVTQELIDAGFMQTLLMSVMNRKWRSVVISLERLAPTIRLAAAADALALLASEPNFSTTYRYEVEKKLEPFFQGRQHACPVTANFGISLWNCVTQGRNESSIQQHNEEILVRCFRELSAKTDIMLGDEQSRRSTSTETIRVLLNCRRWLHYTVLTETSSIATKQRTLFLAFLTACLLSRCSLKLQRVDAASIQLASLFVDASGDYPPLLAKVRKIINLGEWTATFFPPRGAKLPVCLPREVPRLQHGLAQPIEGPLRTLEDQSTTWAFQSALEWFQCSWFSPQATGRRLIPY